MLTVDGDDRFAEAVRRKLLLEMAGCPVTMGELRTKGKSFAQ